MGRSAHRAGDETADYKGLSRSAWPLLGRLGGHFLPAKPAFARVLSLSMCGLAFSRTSVRGCVILMDSMDFIDFH